MSVEMAIWRVTDNGPQRLEFSAFGLEKRLEGLVIEDPSLVGLDVLVIGRQLQTPFGGIIDILCVDVEGRLHLVELKRDKTPRTVVAQALDYGFWVQNLSLEAIAEIYANQHDGDSFDDAFATRFAQAVPDVFNSGHQLTIIASELDPASDRIVQYLAQYGVPINTVFFRHFRDGTNDYVARTWLLPPEEIAAASQSRGSRPGRVRPWNGQDFYVILGNVEQGSSRLELARNYSLLSAGGGSWYWKPLRNLEISKRVFAYVGGAGYVGVGTVKGPLTPAREAVVTKDGRQLSFLQCPDIPEDIRQRAESDDPEITEYVVPVEWEQIRELKDAVSAPGLFASQVTVCKLRDDRTIEALTEAFGLQQDEH